jgi:predicted SAM-dependent methyltransferase
MVMRALQRTLKKIPIAYGVSKWTRDSWRKITGPPKLKKEVEGCAARGEPIRIIIGAGGLKTPQGWLPTNVQFLDLLNEEHWRRVFGDHRLDNVFAEHVWEHLTLNDGKTGAARCFKYLKPGGRMRLAVPDGNHPDPDYLELVRPGGPPPAGDEHLVLYTYDMMRDMLESVGFQVDLLEYYDADHNFHRVPYDNVHGRVLRCHGWTEKRADGSTMPYTSVIVDAIKK